MNAIAPGGIKSDMYTEAARLYIPNGNSLSDEEVDKVSRLCQVLRALPPFS